MASEIIEVEIPFWGFYESIHDSYIDDAVAGHFEDDQGNLPENINDAIYDADINWKAMREEYCELFVDELAQRTGLDFEYTAITSPKYYNFKSDRLFANLPKAQVDKIRKEVEAYPEWETEIKERFTDRDGFWSNYSPDIKHDDWTKDILDQCQYKVMLELYFDHNLEDDWQQWCAEDLLPYEMDSVNDAIEIVNKYIKEHNGK